MIDWFIAYLRVTPSTPFRRLVNLQSAFGIRQLQQSYDLIKQNASESFAHRPPAVLIKQFSFNIHYASKFFANSSPYFSWQLLFLCKWLRWWECLFCERGFLILFLQICTLQWCSRRCKIDTIEGSEWSQGLCSNDKNTFPWKAQYALSTIYLSSVRLWTFICILLL